ncbi:MAG: cbb3-type cytochrome oxidase assembly protein CcoS [Cycloclasticus sp.]|nr:cbb3-type cytochrome oxidase assembly protein CcoS [Cycloclasticus sp.]
MDSLYFLIPVSIVLVAIVIVIFLWAVRSGQFDDLEGPGHSILYEEEQADETEETKDVSKKDA